MTTPIIILGLLNEHVYVVVQFYPWFLNFIFYCFKLITIYHHTQEQQEEKI